MTPALVLSRRLLCGLSLAAIAAPLRAEPVPIVRPWPRRPVRLMTCLADSRSEAMARTLAGALGARWRQAVTVDRHSSAAGAISLEAFLATRDDHALLLAPTDMWTTPPTPVGRFVDPARDLLPLAAVAQDVIVVAVAAKSGLGTLDEVIEAARRRPGALTWTSVSPSPAFAFSSVVRAARVQLAFTPSRTSMSPLADLSEGRLDLALLPMPSAIEATQGGRIRLLAVASAARAPSAPAVPTVAEAGYPALMTMSGHGLFGSRTTPSVQRTRIGDDVGAAVRDLAVAERLARMGYRPWQDSPVVFAAQLEREHARWSEMDQPAYNITAAQ
ncbi:MAG TPA: tripartite tricarboxylate transporter substrate-binding protein [Reyranella sp.]|nr:tripartite tricarboxylate transporter substrate-binding protein [Reyranella sp.]